MTRSVAATKAPGPGEELTVVENLAIALLYLIFGESRYNRTADEYAAFAARLPPLKVLTYRVNEALHEFLQRHADCPPEFIRFKAGYMRRVFETYPREISSETIRTALIKHGFRQPRRSNVSH